MRERSVTQVPTRVYKSRRRRRENYLNGSEEFLLQTFVLASLVSEVLLEAVDTATEHVELRLVVGQLLVLAVDCVLVLLPQLIKVIKSITLFDRSDHNSATTHFRYLLVTNLLLYSAI